MGLRLPERSVLFSKSDVGKIEKRMSCWFFRIFKKFTHGFLEQWTGAAFFFFWIQEARQRKHLFCFCWNFFFATLVQRQCNALIVNFLLEIVIFQQVCLFTASCLITEPCSVRMRGPWLAAQNRFLEWTRLLGKGCKYWIGINVS